MKTREDSGKDSQGVWRQHSRQWSLVGSPLRPLPEDGRLMLEMAAAYLRGKEDPQIAVLGVTPEVVQLPWPKGARLSAMDHSAEMIDKVWRPHSEIESRVLHARWEEMPLPDHSIDVAAGDGSLNNLVALEDYASVAAEVARVLKPGGVMVLRCFVRPDQSESIGTIAADAWRGAIGGFHALKWRLAMLLTRPDDASVAVAGIRDLFDRTFPDRAALAAATGWPRAAIDTIDAYAGLATRYTFPTLAQFRDAVAPLLRVSDVRAAGYELADRCPTICFERTS